MVLKHNLSRLLFIVVTYYEVIPSSSSDHFLHSMIIRSCYAISNHKYEDETNVIANIKD